MAADAKILLWLVILLPYGALIVASDLNYENTVDPVITQVNKKVLLKNNTQRLQNLLKRRHQKTFIRNLFVQVIYLI